MVSENLSHFLTVMSDKHTHYCNSSEVPERHIKGCGGGVDDRIETLSLNGGSGAALQNSSSQTLIRQAEMGTRGRVKRLDGIRLEKIGTGWKRFLQDDIGRGWWFSHLVVSNSLQSMG